MTWDDPLMYEWVHAVAPYTAQACACQFDKDWAKAWMFVFLTSGHQVLQVDDWQSILPKQLSWPDPPGRIENGGGLPSTALHMQPQRHDKMVALRSRWFRPP